MKKVKYKKIRGEKRRIRHIHRWGQQNLTLDMDELKEHQREYVKFWVSPWSRISITNSVYPEPDGKYRALLLHYLVEIYQSWHKRLSATYNDFYLQIWLFENELSHSQVVCAVNERRDFYEDMFPVIDDKGINASQHYLAETAESLDKFTWKQCQVIQSYDPNDEFDQEYIASVTPEKRLGVDSHGYEMVEVDRVWLIENAIS